MSIVPSPEHRMPIAVPTDSHRTLKRIALIALLLAANISLLITFNTLRWPYMWPDPLVYILVGATVVAIWFREELRGLTALRLVGGAMVFIGECYLLHSLNILMQAPSLLALLHFVGFAGTFTVVTLNYVNQFFREDRKTAPPLPAELPPVAAIVPTYGEPLDILEQTVAALVALDYPRERLHILISDDGHRPEVAALAARHGVDYIQGPRREAKAGNLNNALVHLARVFPQAELVITQDADELINPGFLRKTVGYFTDPKMAFVQTPKEVFVPHGDPFGNRDRLFYDTFQPGRNGSGAAFSCGSGVIWRISAVKSIGGYVTWNLVEDLTTSYWLHSAGYRSEYHNEILSIGLSPDDIPGLLKQRGTWATDTWRLFLFDNPLFRKGLTFRQRLQYLELGLFYTASVIFMPLLMLVPLLSLALNTYLPIEGSALLPWILASAAYYATLARGSVEFLTRVWQYWVGHWPTYTKALWIALRSRQRKPSYKVTRKTRVDGFYGHMVWQQFVYIIIAAVFAVRALVGGSDDTLAARITNVALLGLFVFLVSGICRAAFYNVSAAMVGRAFVDYLAAPFRLFRPAPAQALEQVPTSPTLPAQAKTELPMLPAPVRHALPAPSVDLTLDLSPTQRSTDDEPLIEREVGR